MSKKKTKEYKRNSDGKENPKYLTEFEVRAIISNELVFLKEPVHIAGGSIVAGNPNGTGLKLGKDGIMPGSDVSIQGWGNTMTFSAVDADTVQWSAGTLTLTDGTIYNIEAGNTGNMSALTYIYFDINISDTVLQKTTTQATAVGRGRILVAVAQNNAASEATFQVFGGSGGILIKADNIAANSITANEIAANTITASQLSVSQLSAISANLGSINAGTITGATHQTASSGRRIIMGSDQVLRWNNGASTEGYIYNDGSGNMYIDADNVLFIVADGAGDDIWLSVGDTLFATGNTMFFDFTGNISSLCDNHLVYYNEDQDNSDASWFEGGGLKMQLNQSGDLYISGSYDGDNIDFAEMFESFDGKKIPVGTTVVFDNEDKIRAAKKGEIPFGAVSGTAGIILGSGREWNGKYMRNEFGEYIMEEVTFWRVKKEQIINKEDGKKYKSNINIKGIVEDGQKPPRGVQTKKIVRRKINPEYDEKKEFIQRKKREEWNTVGLIGRVRLRKNQPVSPNWIKIRNIGENVEEWLIR